MWCSLPNRDNYYARLAQATAIPRGNDLLQYVDGSKDVFGHDQVRTDQAIESKSTGIKFPDK